MKNSKDSILKNGGGQFVFTPDAKKMNHRSFLGGPIKQHVNICFDIFILVFG